MECLPNINFVPPLALLGSKPTVVTNIYTYIHNLSCLKTDVFNYGDCYTSEHDI